MLKHRWYMLSGEHWMFQLVQRRNISISIDWKCTSRGRGGLVCGGDVWRKITLEIKMTMAFTFTPYSPSVWYYCFLIGKLILSFIRFLLRIRISNETFWKKNYLCNSMKIEVDVNGIVGTMINSIGSGLS